MATVTDPEQASDVVSATSTGAHMLEPLAVPSPSTNTLGVAAPPEEMFHKGIAISVWQNSGGEESNWGRFVERKGGCCTILLTSSSFSCSGCQLPGCEQRV